MSITWWSGPMPTFYQLMDFIHGPSCNMWFVLTSRWYLYIMTKIHRNSGNWTSQCWMNMNILMDLSSVIVQFIFIQCWCKGITFFPYLYSIPYLHYSFFLVYTLIMIISSLLPRVYIVLCCLITWPHPVD
jgi:hypothetical protein